MHFALDCSHSYLHENWQFSAWFSNYSYSNSLNFEAKIKCNTSKPNVPKWRKTCTGLQFDLVHFKGSQSHLLSSGNLWGPCISLQSSWSGPLTKFDKTYCSHWDWLQASVFLSLGGPNQPSEQLAYPRHLGHPQKSCLSENCYDYDFTIAVNFILTSLPYFGVKLIFVCLMFA